MDSTFNTAGVRPASAEGGYIEGLVGYNYLDRVADINRYQEVFDYLQRPALWLS